MCAAVALADGPRTVTGSDWWAFRTPKRSAVPKVGLDRVRSPIDAFIARELATRKLNFGADADRRVFIRRVFVDMLGMPPTPEELAAYLSDSSTNAAESLVDRVLADPRYGERWGRHWLDTAGFAESEGVLQEDRPRPNSWRYRDYVIRSFNADKPYDRFLLEQIAGDELVDYRTVKEWTPEVVDAVAATGFLRNSVDATRDDFNQHQYGEYLYRMLHDTQTILVSSTMGITVQCARCHDHKYEPISQRDYYRIQALLTPAVRPKGDRLPTARRQIVAATSEEQKRAEQINAEVDKAVAAVDAELAALTVRYRSQLVDVRKSEVAEQDLPLLRDALLRPDSARTAADKALLARYKVISEATPAALATAFPEFAQDEKRLKSRRGQESARRITLVTLRAFYDMDATAPPTPLLTRGDWLHPADPVAPGVPEVLTAAAGPLPVVAPSPGAGTTGLRTAFARWLTRPENPLTARVMVNRVWAHHFGRGIVETVDNFGKSGAAPTHPELLDWLATRFSSAEQAGGMGWRLKPLHRLILLSTVYRQSAGSRPDALRADRENRLYWRYPARRLDAESLRDSVLKISGSLDSTMFGESIGLQTRPTGEHAPLAEEGSGRRTIYLAVRRTTPISFLAAFDAPVMETNCSRRSPSATPTQALALMNGGFVHAQARRFAERLLKEVPGEVLAPTRMLRAYELAYSRLPSVSERTQAADFLRKQEARHRAGGTAATEAALAAWADFCHALFSSNEFLYTD